jgi:hypothetical protein
MTRSGSRRWRRRGDPRRAGFDVVWVGDVLLSSSARKDLERHGYQWAFAHLKPLLRADYVIGNAEGPITELKEKHFSGQRFSYRARPKAAPALARAGFDALSLSNNHIFDRGPVGLTDSIRLLRAAGVTPFGAGVGSEATSPLLIDTPHGRVGVVGIGERWSRGRTATADESGTIPLDPAGIRNGHTLARAAGARWVIAYVHWGENYQPVTGRQVQQAADFARAGYDLVIGTGSHTAQPVEVIDGMPVLYSLGNFTFGTKGRFHAGAPGYGLVARTTFGPGGIGVEIACIRTDNRQVRFQPRRCSGADARAVLAGLGASIDVGPARRVGARGGWLPGRRRPVGHVRGRSVPAVVEPSRPHR